MAIAVALMAAVAYWIAFATPAGAAAILPAMASVFLLGRLATNRQAFYIGLITGMAMYVPHLWFFHAIFGWKAIALWLVAGFPIGVFVLLLSLARRRLGPRRALLLAPILWTGIEFFRSELYYLRFAWLLPGEAAAFLPGIRLAAIGVYGLGFIYAIAAAMLVAQVNFIRISGAVAMIVLAILMYWPPSGTSVADSPLHVAGIQLEFSEDQQAANALTHLAQAHPEAQILVLSEYSFIGPIPQVVRDVVKKYRRYLIAGGIQVLPGRDFYDMAFVVGPDGRDVFAQGKSVPVQCMDDGLPAPRRRVWNSPWGGIGIAVCYDLSYARVMDDFVRQGARGLIIPTMDVAQWGDYERRMLHGRMAPIRSVEYGIPTFGVWSSGMSQLTDRYGRVIATAGYPGQGEMISGPFDVSRIGHVPPDRLLAVTATALIGLFILYLGVRPRLRSANRSAILQ